MKKAIGFITVLILGLFLYNSSYAEIPSSLGWYEIPNTRINDVCACTHGFPDTCYIEGCPAITIDWSGGIMDTSRNRLIIWGGGHAGYGGNELYALSLNSLTMIRLTDPGDPFPISTPGCPAILPTPYPQPTSMHSYDSMVYLPNQDKLLIFGGAPAPCTSSGYSNNTWEFDLASMHWNNRNPYGSPPAADVPRLTYDPNAGNVFAVTNNSLRLYNYNSNTWTEISDTVHGVYQTSIIDVANKKFLLIGNGTVDWYDIDPAQNKCVDANHKSSCVKNTMSIAVSPAHSANWPGLAWDSDQNKVVAWAGGNNVYVLNPNYANNTGTWTTIAYSGGPGAALANGTYKRFQYSPASKVFVAYNNTNQNGYTLRLYNYGSNSKFPGIPGCTNAYYIDADCDGYGVASPSGLDADDNDASVNTTASTLNKYGNIVNYLSARGYPNQSVYYIALSGNDSTAAKNDVSRPYKTWNAVNALLQPGDVVMFRAGTYYGNQGAIGEYGIGTAKQGTLSNPIVIMNYPGEKVITDTISQGLSSAGTSHTNRGAKYVIFDGLVLTNTRNTGLGGAINVEFSDNIALKNIEEYGFIGSIWSTEDVQGLVLEGSVIRDNGEHGIYLGANNYPGDNATLRYNIFYRNGWHGMKWNGRANNLYIHHNIIHSNGMSGLDFENGVSNSTIDHNYIFNNENQGIIFYNYPSVQASIDPYEQTANTISNNVIWVGEYAPITGNCTNPNITSNFSAVRFANDIKPVSWQPNHNYCAGCDGGPDNYAPVVSPSVPNGYIYRLISPGISGGSEPNWNTTQWGTTNDGTAQWRTNLPATFDNNTIRNNTIVAYNGPIFLFNQNDYWDTTTISNNTLNKTSGSTNIMKIANDVYTMSQFNVKSPLFTNNLNADPGFKDVSVNYCGTPEKFDFTTAGSTTLKGDVNQDTKIDILDVQALVNHILGTQDYGSNADVNSDSSVDVLDVQEVVNIILGV